MRAIDADALQLAIVEEGQANKRKKYIIGDIWELTGAEIREVINSQPTIQPKRGRWHYSDGKPARIGLSFGVICDQCGTESEYCTNFCGRVWSGYEVTT